MSRRNLRATPALRELAQRLFQRQPDLFRIPPSGEPRGDGLTIVELDAEAGETERARPILSGWRVIYPEPVTRLVLTAPSAKRRGVCARCAGSTCAGVTRPARLCGGASHPSGKIECQLAFTSNLSDRV